MTALAALTAVVAIAGCGLSGNSTYKVGDRVEVTPSVLHGFDIKKVSGDSASFAADVYTVHQVHDGTSYTCDGGLTTFADKPAGKTYCIAPF